MWPPKKTPKTLLPWYAAGSLDEAERARVEAWLEATPQAGRDARRLRAVRQAVSGQPQAQPPARIQARVRAQAAVTPQLRPLPRWLQAAWSLTLALACALILWGAWQPGVVLQWQAPGGAWTAFRVYRAPAGGAEFTLLDELPVRQDAAAYRYTDSRLFPGEEYVYRVEGVTAAGNVVLSETVRGDGAEVLPQVVSIALFSLGLGLLGMLMLPGGVPAARRRAWHNGAA